MLSPIKISSVTLLVCATACSQTDRGNDSLEYMTLGDTTTALVRGPGVWGESVIFSEELRIGKVDGEAEYVFGEVSDVTVDSGGTIYVLDRQLPIVRRYDAEGKHLGSFGVKGQGPGELLEPMGMLITADGRVIVRDFGNARMSVYSPDGTALGQWPLPAGFSTSDPILSDSANNVYTRVIAQRLDGGRNLFGYMQFDSRGNVVDTIRGPYDHFEPAQIIVRNGNAISVYRVPFAAGAYWTINRRGEIVGGIGSVYAIDARARDGKVFRIERAAPPVPVQPAERDAREEMLRRNAVRMLPGWTWTGPRSPDVKPAFMGFRIAADGRIWVQVSQPGVRLAPNPDAPPDPSGLPALDRWSEPRAFDVFEPNGAYLGRVHPPERFTIAFSRGEAVWGVLRDENDVEFVARYRIASSR